jgi:hypothetical protein
MTILPNRDQNSAVFTTTNPVTQTAEADVNKAFIYPTLSPLLLAIGRLSKIEPKRIKLPNPIASTVAGLN